MKINISKYIYMYMFAIAINKNMLIRIPLDLHCLILPRK